MEVWVLSDEMYTWFYLFSGFCGLRLCVFCVTYSFPCFTWSMFLVFELSFSFFSFPLYFNWGFNQPVIHIGSLDLCHRKPGFVHGLTVVISFWRVCMCVSVCVWVCARQFLHDGWGWNLFSYVLSVLLQCGGEWETSTCIHWYNIIFPSATSTFSQSASWMDTDGASLPCISFSFCISTTCAIPGIALTWFCDSSQIFAWCKSLVKQQDIFVFSRHSACVLLNSSSSDGLVVSHVSAAWWVSSRSL